MKAGLSTLAGAISIDVTANGNTITDVKVQSSRPLEVVRLLEGKTVEQAALLVPLLYSACANAQQIACVIALENALGRQPSAVVQAARTALLAAETVKEIAIKLATVWFPNQGLQPAQLVAWCAALKKQLSWALVVGAKAPEGAKASNLLQPDIGVTAPQDWLSSLGTLNDEASIVCQRLSELDTLFADVLLADQLSPLEPHIAAVCHALAAPADSRFTAQPTLNGQCYETGFANALAQGQAEHHSWASRRLLALMAGFSNALQQVQAQWPTQDSHGINSHDKARDYIGVQPTPALSKVDNRENAGLGALTTARGLLVHYAHVVDGKVNGYRIVAPTEWNFHPQGSVHALLKGAHIPSGNLAQVVKHVVALIDPCVEYHVTVKAT